MGIGSRVALVLTVLLCVHACPASCAVTHMEVTPGEPVRGDAITVGLRAAPGETVEVQIRYSKVLQVSGGRYLMEIGGVEIPAGPNSFTVKATNVASLVVAVRLGVWVSVSKEAAGGAASISQGGVPPGRYDIQVKGDAAPGASEVTVEVTARTRVTVGGDGGYTVSYDTSSIPAGVFRVIAGGLSRVVTLGESAGSTPRQPSPPVADFTAPSSAVAGRPITLDASASCDADGSILGYTWDMGDGAILHGVTVTYAYAEEGRYNVTLTVVDDSGLTGKKVEVLPVAERQNLPPVPLVSTRRTCYTGQVVGFSAHASWDPDGRIASYSWDLGDGASAAGAAVTHMYASPGPRNVTLVVTDEEGLTGTATIHVDVVAPLVGTAEWSELALAGGGLLELPGGRGRLMVNASDEAHLLFFMYTSNPHPHEAPPPGQVGGYMCLSAGDPDAINWPILLEASYDEASVSESQAAGLGLYRYSVGWLRCRDTGSDPQRGVVWARIHRDELEGSALTLGARPSVGGAAVRSLKLSSGTVNTGAEIVVQAEVRNLLGDEAVFALPLEVDGRPVSLRTVRLGPGEARLIDFTLTLEEPGPHLVGVGGVNLTVLVGPPGEPDLAVLAAFPEGAEAGRPVVVAFTVSNLGEAESPPFTVSLYAGASPAGTLQLGALGPGCSVDAEVTWTPGGAGPCSLRVVVDGGGLVPEADEGNNSMEGTVVVAGPPEAEGWPILALGAALIAAAATSLRIRLVSRHPPQRPQR